VFSFRKSNKAVEGRVGVQLDSSGVSLAHVVPMTGGLDRLEFCEFRSCTGPQEWIETLSAMVVEHGLAGADCVCVISPESYSLYMVNTPPLDPSERRDAARWLVQDLIDFDPIEAAADAFPLPENANRGLEHRAYVAVARQEHVGCVQEAIQNSGLVLEAIDIVELCMSNIAAMGPSSEHGTAMVYLGAKGGTLTLSRGTSLYLARDVSLGGEQLIRALDGVEFLDETELPPEATYALDMLVLELQRSLDYYESELGQSPAAQILLAAAGVEPAQVVPHLTRNLSATIRAFDVNEVLECASAASWETQIQCLPAIGAALRRNSEQCIDLQPQAIAPTRDALTLGSIGRICAVTALALTAICVGSGWQLQGQRSLASELGAERAALNKWTQELMADPASLVLDPALKASVEALQVQRDAQLRLLHALGDQGPSQLGGFSDFFEGFASSPVPGLWLTGFSIEDGGSALAVNGSARTPKLAPQLVERLRARSIFEGFEFQQFHMERSVLYEGVVDFTFNTRSERPES
jgi:MSHA biogenesis protein MshI